MAAPDNDAEEIPEEEPTVMLTILLILSVLALAYANGANDNFKGVATLYGSATLSFRRALWLATGATVLGSLVSIALARGIAAHFSGKGIVPDALTQSPAFLVAIAGAGALTILLATRLGFPTSTTHSLVGALIGTALVESGGVASGDALWTSFLRPLLISPFVAFVAAIIAYRIFASCRRRLGVEPDSCICIDEPAVSEMPSAIGAHAVAMQASPALSVAVGRARECAAPRAGLRVGARWLLDVLHGTSAASVCFARAVNDTPKIAVLWIAAAATTTWPLVAATVAVAAGGWFSARRVAETMSKRMTAMNPGQGATSNFITAAIVLGASRFGMPVSTTHVACGSIIGIGATTGQSNGSVVRNVLLAWVVTLPLGAALGAALYALLS